MPLASILALLKRDGETQRSQERLAKWFWCGVLGEMYGSAVETTFARDLQEVVAWVRDDGPEPSTIRDAAFQANRLLTLRTRNSAAYKGIHALLMREGSRDFRTGRHLQKLVFEEESIDIHHVFPRDWCERRRLPIPRQRYDSIVNKTAISTHTNIKIGGRAPSKYLFRLEEDIDRNTLDNVLESHKIPVEELRSDDFWMFFDKRAEELLRLIQAAMGKEIARDPEAFKPDGEIEEYEDDIEQ